MCKWGTLKRGQGKCKSITDVLLLCISITITRLADSTFFDMTEWVATTAMWFQYIARWLQHIRDIFCKALTERVAFLKMPRFHIVVQ